MIIRTVQRITKDGELVGLLHTYLKGDGNPDHVHTIEGFSIDGHGQGNIGKQDKVENLSDIELYSSHSFELTSKWVAST